MAGDERLYNFMSGCEGCDVYTRNLTQPPTLLLHVTSATQGEVNPPRFSLSSYFLFLLSLSCFTVCTLFFTICLYFRFFSFTLISLYFFCLSVCLCMSASGESVL